MTPLPSLAPLRLYLSEAAWRLRQAGLTARDASFDAEFLARAVLGWDRATVLARADEPPPGEFAARYEQLVARRERREPAAQVIGYREFWGRDFLVTRDVLIPRPETELIVETALALHSRATPARVVDVGTGTGCLAISLAAEWPGASIVATDVSEAALYVARSNAERHGVARQVHFVRASVLSALAPGFDLIVANPPYVRNGDRNALGPEVRDYEPAEALFGGEDGLEIVRALLDQTAERLAPRGRLLMEFGAGQDDRVVELVAERRPLILDEVRNDLSGIPRMAVVSRRVASTIIAT